MAEIDDDVPPPTTRRRQGLSSKWPFDALEAGEGFYGTEEELTLERWRNVCRLQSVNGKLFKANRTADNRIVIHRER